MGIVVAKMSSSSDISSEYRAYKNSKGAGRRSSAVVAKSLEEVQADELAGDGLLEAQLKAQREKEAIARAYAHKLLVEKEAALSAQKQKESERVQEQKRVAEERLKFEEEKAKKLKEMEDAQQRAEEEKQARIAEQLRIEQERANAEKTKSEREKEKSLSSVRSKIEENRKKFEQQQKELEDKRAQEELDRLKQKALAVERERNRQRMLQANNEAFSTEIAAITSKLEQQQAFEKQQNDAFESEHGLSLQNVSKSVLQFMPWQGTDEVKVLPPGEEDELEEKAANPLLSFFTSTITAPVSLFANILLPSSSSSETEPEPEKVVNMDNFIYTLGTTGISVIIFLARGKEKGDALFYAANMKFNRKFDLVFNASTEFGKKELTFPCEVINEVEDGRGYYHGGSQPFTFSYENVPSKTLHFKLTNKPDLNIQFETAVLKNDMLLFFRSFLKQKLQIKQNKLGLDGAQSFLNAETQEMKRMLWVEYGFRKSKSMFGLGKGKSIPLLVVVDNNDGATITLFRAPEEHSVPINEFKNSISGYFDKSYSPEIFEGMGYSVMATHSLKKCKNVLYLREDFAVELDFEGEEGAMHREVICFATKELQDAAGSYLTKAYKKAKTS